ncbi:hypothetical protein CPB83DRAFT_841964 [Crepidotus variabilis]|uniref:Uncharacterized protein n=1 Tax=Crepidotus variabilis TaxID=179855 RepID=A0A9P6ESW6_9AGAR|nr:hypothetical protein CPB83DRAFT_841964 [Crepidotus variabilis]
MPSIAQTTLFFVLATAILAAPAPLPDSNLVNNAYSGTGGDSKGGDVEAASPSSLRPGMLSGVMGGKPLLNLASIFTCI